MYPNLFQAININNIGIRRKQFMDIKKRGASPLAAGSFDNDLHALCSQNHDNSLEQDFDILRKIPVSDIVQIVFNLKIDIVEALVVFMLYLGQTGYAGPNLKTILIILNCAV